MNGSDILFGVGLVLGIVEEIQANGKSLLGYAVIALSLGLLLPFFK